MADKFKKTAWKPTCNRFVAFLDIMGFEDMVLRRSHKEVHKILTTFVPELKIIDWYTIGVSDDIKNSATSKLVIFSDSIIIFSSDDTINSAAKIISDVGWILNSAITQQLPIKGAISHGEQTADLVHSLYFGKPLIDAYKLQHELLLYSAVLHHTAEKRLNAFHSNKLLARYGAFRWNTPMKSGKINHYVVDWTEFNIEHKNPLNLISKLYDNVSGAPRIYVDNTLEFVREIKKKKAKLNRKETKKKT